MKNRLLLADTRAVRAVGEEQGLRETTTRP
jgi:hypothetical protein